MSLLIPMPGIPRCPDAMNGSEAIRVMSAPTGSHIRNDSRSTKLKRRYAADATTSTPQAISASSPRSGIDPSPSAPKWTRAQTAQTVIRTARPTELSSHHVSLRPSSTSSARPTSSEATMMRAAAP